MYPKPLEPSAGDFWAYSGTLGPCYSGPSAILLSKISEHFRTRNLWNLASEGLPTALRGAFETSLAGNSGIVLHWEHVGPCYWNLSEAFSGKLGAVRHWKALEPLDPGW